MSLHNIAQHMAAHGRNGDSMLVHMTPHEVAGLQSLAEKHGTSLTVNPHTGLPEAFSLGDLAKAAVPVLAGAALGPAGFGIASSAMGAAAMVGGVTALASGNLQQGLMAGLGAYGGYGLGEGLASLGAEELAKDKAADEAAKTALSGTDLASDMAAQKTADASAAKLAEAGTTAGVDGVVGAAPGTPTPVSPLEAAQTGQTVQTVTQVPPAAQPSYFDKMSAGFDRATGKGGLDALSAQMKTLGGPSLGTAAGTAAMGAVGSGLMNQENPAADAKKLGPGYIRPYTYNPFGQKYTAMTPVKADEWGARTMATGGIVALANGGPPPEQDQFNTMTGGSKAAYDYLMGQGEYPIKPVTPTGEVYKPYAEATMGMQADPTQFATTYNQQTRQYENNPNYKPFTFDMATNQDTRGASANEINKLISDPANLAVTKPETAPSGWLGGAVDKAIAEGETRPYWMVANNLTYDDLSRATGSSVADVMKRFPKTTTTATPAAPVDYGSGFNTGGLTALANGGLGTLGGYSDGGRLLKGPGDGVSDSIPASIGDKQPARLADGEFVVPARIVSELGNGSTDAGARKLYQMMDRVQKARGKTTGKGKVATNSRADKYLPV